MILWWLSATLAYAAPEWRQLHAHEAMATSFLKSNWNKYTENYHPSYALDGNPKTAWVEGVEGNGEHERLTIPFSALESARAVRLRIRNGYQKSESLLAANAAPKDVRVHVLDAVGRGVTHKDVTLERVMGWQEVTVDVPGGRGVARVELEVLSVHPGKTYRDTCVSDVELYVDSDVPYNADVEAKKKAALQRWIDDRLATAKYFATQPTDYPFAATAYRNVSDQAPNLTDVGATATFSPWRAAMAETAGLSGWWRVDKVAALPLPDGGGGALSSIADLLDPKRFALFEAPDEGGKRTHRGDDLGDFVSDEWRSNAKITWSDGPGSTPRRMWFKTRTINQGRGTSIVNAEWVVAYNEGGRVTGVYRRAREEGDFMEAPYESETLVTFRHDDAGRIVGWTQTFGEVGGEAYVAEWVAQ